MVKPGEKKRVYLNINAHAFQIQPYENHWRFGPCSACRELADHQDAQVCHDGDFIVYQLENHVTAQYLLRRTLVYKPDDF
jgi:hypothetical protein